jgi:transposase
MPLPTNSRGEPEKVKVAHPNLQTGNRCPDCGRGNVYEQKDPRLLVRIVGQAPLAATVYELERLRCNACGQIFTAQEPEGVGAEKYDETAAAMIAQMKYGSGVPFYRLEQMEELMGIPLPAATQWEIVEEAAEVMKPARDELIRQAAQGEVLHNDDTSMRVLRLAREPSDDRTGVFTSNILAIAAASHRIALYFTGRQHAGENMADVLKQARQRAAAADSDVRCAVAKHAESGRRGDPAGQLYGPRKAPVRGYRTELSRRVPLCARIARRSLLQRRHGA